MVAGLSPDPADPGYHHVLIGPEPGGGLTSARATLATVYGEVTSGWERAADTLRLVVRIPPNAHATVRLPDASLPTVTEGAVPAATADGVTSAKQDGQAAVLEIGSGDYRFSWRAAPPASP